MLICSLKTSQIQVQAQTATAYAP